MAMPEGSFENVQLCLLNAERLLADSKKTTSPTAVALVEFSLEELMKGWMLIFIYTKNKLDKLTETERKATMEKLGLNLGSLKNEFESMSEEDKEKFGSAVKVLFEPELKEAFWKHDIKLEYLAALLTYLKYCLPLLMKIVDKESYIGTISKITGDYTKLKLSQEEITQKIGETQSHLEKFKTENLNILEKVKQRTLYVDVENGILISPNMRTFELEELKWLAEILQILLKINAMAMIQN